MLWQRVVTAIAPLAAQHISTVAHKRGHEDVVQANLLRAASGQRCLRVFGTSEEDEAVAEWPQATLGNFLSCLLLVGVREQDILQGPEATEVLVHQLLRREAEAVDPAHSDHTVGVHIVQLLQLRGDKVVGVLAPPGALLLARHALRQAAAARLLLHWHGRAERSRRGHDWHGPCRDSAAARHQGHACRDRARLQVLEALAHERLVHALGRMRPAAAPGARAARNIAGALGVRGCSLKLLTGFLERVVYAVG
mmetsp:Transcript_84506/g.217670  ORF Transcript_84506/g.217670 Transcript_84506/m.217670 type:complete len:252 (+) Transcript_84506:319-1074(+)